MNDSDLLVYSTDHLVVVRPPGELDASGSAQLRDAVREASESTASLVVLDLVHVSAVPDGQVGILADVAAEVRRDGRELIFANTSDALRETVERAELERLVELHPAGTPPRWPGVIDTSPGGAGAGYDAASGAPEVGRVDGSYS